MGYNGKYKEDDDNPFGALSTKVFIGIIVSAALLFWNFGVPYLMQEKHYENQGTSHGEQSLIAQYNPKLDRFSSTLKYNETHDEKIPTIPLASELIDLMNKLIAFSPRDTSLKEELAGFHIHIYGVTEDSEQALKHLELSVAALESVFETDPSMLVSSEMLVTRDRLFHGYLRLLQTDPEKAESNAERVAIFFNKIPEDEKTEYGNIITYLYTEGTLPQWTEERLEALEQLWKGGHSAAEIAEKLGGLSRNAVMRKIERNGITRN